MKLEQTHWLCFGFLPRLTFFIISSFVPVPKVAHTTTHLLSISLAVIAKKKKKENKTCAASPVKQHSNGEVKVSMDSVYNIVNEFIKITLLIFYLKSKTHNSNNMHIKSESFSLQCISGVQFFAYKSVQQNCGTLSFLLTSSLPHGLSSYSIWNIFHVYLICVWQLSLVIYSKTYF